MKERMFFKSFVVLEWWSKYRFGGLIRKWRLLTKLQMIEFSHVIFDVHISDIKIFFIWINVSQILLESLNINGFIIFFLGKPIIWNQISKEDRRLLKFTFSEKATKIDKIFTVNLTVCSNRQIDGEDFVNVCGLLRKHEL